MQWLRGVFIPDLFTWSGVMQPALSRRVHAGLQDGYELAGRNISISKPSARLHGWMKAAEWLCTLRRNIRLKRRRLSRAYWQNQNTTSPWNACAWVERLAEKKCRPTRGRRLPRWAQ